MAWWKGSVTYQVYPRSFQDSNGDGIGDLPGITARLSHIADLGADAVWLSPVFRSPMADMGYDVSDYCDIDPVFGTLADFDALVARAHGLGLKVVIDQVISHCSAAHPFFAESRRARSGPKADWFVWAEPKPDGSAPTNWLSVFGGPAWTWDARRRQYYLHNFLPVQPDWNIHNPAVQDYLLGTLRFWLERGVDGFRLDTVNYYLHDRALRDNPPRAVAEAPANPLEMQDQVHNKNRPENLAFLRRLRALLDLYPDRMMVGEVGDSGARAIEVMGAYTGGGDKLHMAYSFELLSPGLSAAQVRAAVEGFFHGAPDGWPMWAFSNHDVVRHVSRWAPAGAEDAVARLACAVLLSLPGSVCLYQGEELGQTETDILWEEVTDPPGKAFWPDYKGRDGCRTPMVWDGSLNGGFTTGVPWLPVKPPQLARHAAGQGPGSVLEFYREMLVFRQRFRTAGFRFAEAPPPLLVVERGAVTGVFNLGPERAVWSGPGPLAGPRQGARREGAALVLDGFGLAFVAAQGSAGATTS
jgi:alpha-glucosidase